MMRTIPEICLETEEYVFDFSIGSPDISQKSFQRAFSTSSCNSESFCFTGTIEQIKKDFVIYPLKAATSNIFSKQHPISLSSLNYFYRI